MYRLGQTPENTAKASGNQQLKSQRAAELVRTNPIRISKSEFKSLPTEMQESLIAGDVEKVASLLIPAATAAMSGTAGSDFLGSQFRIFADTVSKSMGGFAALPDGAGPDGSAALTAAKASSAPDVMFYQLSLGDDPTGTRTKASVLGNLTGSLAVILVRETTKLPKSRIWWYVGGGTALLAVGLGAWWYMSRRKE